MRNATHICMFLCALATTAQATPDATIRTDSSAPSSLGVPSTPADEAAVPAPVIAAPALVSEAAAPPSALPTTASEAAAPATAEASAPATGAAVTAAPAPPRTPYEALLFTFGLVAFAAGLFIMLRVTRMIDPEVSGNTIRGVTLLAGLLGALVYGKTADGDLASTIQVFLAGPGAMALYETLKLLQPASPANK